MWSDGFYHWLHCGHMEHEHRRLFERECIHSERVKTVTQTLKLCHKNRKVLRIKGKALNLINEKFTSEKKVLFIRRFQTFYFKHFKVILMCWKLLIYPFLRLLNGTCWPGPQITGPWAWSYYDLNANFLKLSSEVSTSNVINFTQTLTCCLNSLTIMMCVKYNLIQLCCKKLFVVYYKKLEYAFISDKPHWQ